MAVDQMKSRPFKAILSVLRRLLLLTCAVLYFAINLAVGALLHLDLPITRAAIARIVEKGVSDSLRGRLHIREISRLAETGVQLEGVEIQDPSNRTVLRVRTLRANVNPLGVVKRILAGYEKLSIEITEVRVEGFEVYLLQTDDLDAKGQRLTHLSLSDAFEPLPSPQAATSSLEKPIRIWFPKVDLVEVYARGAVAGSNTFEAQVGSARASVLATDKGAAIDVKRFEIMTSGILGANARAHGEVHVRAPGAVWGAVKGNFGKIPLKQEFRFQNDSIELKGTLPEIDPSAAKALLGTWPLDQRISVTNNISGKLSDLNVAVTVKGQAQDGVWPGAVEVTGKVNVIGNVRGKIEVITESLNLASFDSTLPTTVIDSETHVEVAMLGARPLLKLTALIHPGSVEGIATPQIDVDASADGSKYSVDAVFEEQGISARAHVESDTDGVVRVAVEFPKTHLNASPRLQSFLPGLGGVAEAKLQGTLTDGMLTSSGNLKLGSFRFANAKVNDTNVSFTNEIDLQDLKTSQGNIEGSLHGLSYGSMVLDRLDVTAKGPILRPRVEVQAGVSEGVKLSASSEVSFETQELFEFRADLAGRGQPVQASARHVAWGNSRLVISDFFAKSIGEIKGDLNVGRDGGKVDLTASGMDLTRIGEALGFAKSEMGGLLNAKVDLEFGGQAHGTVAVDIRNGTFYGVSGVELDAQSTIDDRQISGSAQATVAHFGSLTGEWNGSLAGPLLSERSYLDASGNLSLKLKDLDLRTLSMLTKDSSLPKLKGFVEAQLEIERPIGSTLPAIELSTTTRELSVELNGELLEGVDLDLAAHLRAGSQIVETALHLSDARGPLASFSGEVTPPLLAWSENAPSAEEFIRGLHSAPLNIVAVIPDRKIGAWPKFMPRFVDEGSLSARLVLDGTIDAPAINLLVEGHALEGGQTHFGEPLDLKWAARYIAKSGSLRGSMSAERSTQRLGSFHYDFVVPFEHFFDAPKADVPLWTGSAQLLLESTPLHLIEEMKKVDLSGRAQGSIEIERSALLPQVRGELNLRNLRVKDHRLGDVRMDLNTHESDLITRAEFSDEFGSLRLSAELGLTATSAFALPTANRPIFLTLQSEQYNAAVLAPFLADTFDEFSGNLNGQLRAELRRTVSPSNGKGGKTEEETAPTEGWEASFSGGLELKDGVFTPSALGLRLSDAQLSLSANPKGEFNVVNLDHFRAKAASKVQNLTGSGEFIFRGFSLEKGSFQLVPENVPFLLDGAKMADLTGEARGQFAIEGDDFNLEFGIDDLSAEIAEASDSNLISLDENPDIQILQAEIREQIDENLPRDGMNINLLFRLGENVRLKGTGLDIRVTGSPELRIGEKTEMRGEIEFIRGGRFQIMGRGFTLEPGVVTFDTGESDNPHVSAAASWTAPNGVVVRMSVRGTVREPLLEWSSEPTLPGGEGEIISLILGGGGNSDQTSAGTASLAIAANEALGASGVSGVQVYMTQQESGGEGRMSGMTESNWSNYTAAIRLNEKLWFEGSFQKGTTGFQTTERSGVSGTLDWRFHPQWSARTELGTLGAGLDLLWRYRY